MQMGNLSGGGGTARAFPCVVVLNIKRKYKRNAWQFISADCHRCGRAVAHIYNEKTNDALRCVRMPVRAVYERNDDRPLIYRAPPNLCFRLHRFFLFHLSLSLSLSFSFRSFECSILLPLFLSFSLFTSERKLRPTSEKPSPGINVYEGFCNTYDA